MLAFARYNAFAQQDEENKTERAAFLERIRVSAKQEPEDTELQLALGFAELASGNAAAAHRQFTMTWILDEQRRRAIIDRGQTTSPCKQLEPWSQAYAFACVSEGPQPKSYGIFRPIDQTRLNLAGAKLLRAEGAGLAALSFYGTLINTNFASRPPLKHIQYRNFWITYYQDRWVAVPQSFPLSWILPASLGSGMSAPPYEYRRWTKIGAITIWIRNRIASLIRFGFGLPGSTLALRFFTRFRNFVFQRMGGRFGVLSATELSTLKQKIDVLSS